MDDLSRKAFAQEAQRFEIHVRYTPNPEMAITDNGIALSHSEICALLNKQDSKITALEKRQATDKARIEKAEAALSACHDPFMGECDLCKTVFNKLTLAYGIFNPQGTFEYKWLCPECNEKCGGLST